MFVAFKSKVDSSRYAGLSDEFLIGPNVKATYEEWVGLDKTYCAGYAKVISSHSMLDGDDATIYENPQSDEPLGLVFVAGKKHSSGVSEYAIFVDHDYETNKNKAIELFNEKVAEGVNNGEQVFVALLLEGTDWDDREASTYRKGKSYS